jgi:hypothetical protein
VIDGHVEKCQFWIALSQVSCTGMKYPFEVAEYDAANTLLKTTVFVRWASHVIKKRSRIMADVTKRYHKGTHKFGIEVPNNWDDCVRLDKDNDNTLCMDAVRKEMKNVRIAFNIINGE